MRVSVGLPLYDGKLDHHLAGALLTETSLAQKLGIDLMMCMVGGCSDLARGRNQLVHEFLKSDADRMVFLDSDVTFEPGELIKIASHREDVVGGAYRFKEEGPERYPIAFLDDPEGKGLWANEHGLLEVAHVPTGFMSLSRQAFRLFREAYPGRTYWSRGEQQYCYFQIPYSNGILYTEDVYFCNEWRASGGKVYLDPELTLTHWRGNIPFKGHIGNWLKGRAGISPAA